MTSNEELVQRIQSGIDKDANTEALWLQNTGIVRKLAAGYARDQFEEEDLMQEGYFALVRAAGKYDPDGGARFITYFIIHLNAQMRRYISKTRASVSTPIRINDMILKYLRIKNDLKTRLGADPSDQLISLLMDVSMKKLQEVQKAAEGYESLSLDEIQTEDDLSLYDKIPDPDDAIENLLDDIVLRQLSEQLWKMVDELDPVEQEVIKDIYLRNKSGAEIGRERGMTRAGISRIKVNALKKLKRNPAYEKLKTMAIDVYGIGLRGPSLAAFQRTWTSSTERAALKLLELRRKTDYNRGDL